MLDQILNNPVLAQQYLNNSLLDYSIAVIAFIVLLIVFKLFQTIILKKLEKVAAKTKTDIDDTLIKIVESLKPPFYSFLAFYIALFFLNINPVGQKIINAILIIWLTYQVIQGLQILIDYVLKKRLIKGEEGEAKKGMGYLSTLIKITLWALGTLVVLGNLGVDVTSLIAGLGIGGIAIALALQNILGDLFSSLAIYFDKPFEVGDFIIIGQDKGTVEKIGIKTTRIRALNGEELVISNNELTSARIQNFKTIQARRASALLGVTYNTSQTKLKLIPKLIKDAVASAKIAKFDRVHFTEFGDSALIFELVYYVETEDMKKFMDAQQQVNFKIKYAFEKEGIEMAYPTQTVHLAK